MRQCCETVDTKRRSLEHGAGSPAAFKGKGTSRGREPPSIYKHGRTCPTKRRDSKLIGLGWIIALAASVGCGGLPAHQTQWSPARPFESLAAGKVPTRPPRLELRDTRSGHRHVLGPAAPPFSKSSACCARRTVLIGCSTDQLSVFRSFSSCRRQAGLFDTSPKGGAATGCKYSRDWCGIGPLAASHIGP